MLFTLRFIIKLGRKFSTKSSGLVEGRRFLNQKVLGSNPGDFFFSTHKTISLNSTQMP